MQFIPFNSRDIRHKSKFGSTAAGEKLWLCVCMPRDMRCTAVYLVAAPDGEEKRHINLGWRDTDNVTEWWGIEYSFDEAGLYFYHFEYDTPFGRGKIFLHSSGMGQMCDGGREWQQTVYPADFRTPECFKGGVMYQIFPDRFRNSGIEKKNVPSDRIMKKWNEEVKWECDDDGEFRCDDYYGGDFAGIEEKLDRIASLGVTYIYLNPVSEAHSNHRYNTADYMKPDSLLGTEEDFERLCRKADEYGIKIILDGVFSHTGDDSIYFNRNSRYDSVGAYGSPDSPYREWYTFREDGSYASWWGFETLPETNEENESFSEFITGENGVISHWMKAGASGYRLDVADELPDAFIEKIRSAVKRENENAILIGEVWEDASNKISLGGRRKYFSGKELDSVMNYPFREAVTGFMLNGIAEDFTEAVVTVTENYPPQVLDCLMNFLSTHDTERIFTVLGGINAEGHDREWQASAVLDEKQKKKAETLLRAAYILLYTLPGVPCIYYGDEMLLEGCKDPFNRRPYPWDREDTKIFGLLVRLGQIRKQYKCLAHGRFSSVSAMLGCAAYERICDEDRLMVISNMNPDTISYFLPGRWHGCRSLTGERTDGVSVEIPPYTSTILSF